MNSLLPLLLVSLTIVPALISFALPDRLAVWRDAINEWPATHSQGTFRLANDYIYVIIERRCNV